MGAIALAALVLGACTRAEPTITSIGSGSYEAPSFGGSSSVDLDLVNVSQPIVIEAVCDARVLNWSISFDGVTWQDAQDLASAGSDLDCTDRKMTLQIQPSRIGIQSSGDQRTLYIRGATAYGHAPDGVVNISYTLDTTPATVAITSPADGATINAGMAGSLRLEGMCSENMRTVQITGTGGFTSAAICAGNLFSVLLDIRTMSDGPLSLTVTHDDAAGNPAATDTKNYIKETTVPGVSIATTASNPTKDTVVPLTITFTEGVTGFTASDLQIVNGTISNFVSVSATEYTMDFSPSASGSFSVALPANSAQDAAGNGNTVAATLNGVADYVAPSVTLSTTATDPAPLAAFTVTAAFSESVTGFALADVQITNGTASSLAGSGANYSFTVTPSGNGSLSVSLPSASVMDAAGNANSASNTLTRTIDGLSPSVTGITSSTPNGYYKAGAIIDLQVSFSESVVVTGAPTLEMAGLGSVRSASYVTGSGTATLSFRYTVQNGDSSADLDTSNASLFSYPGGAAIKDPSGNSAANTVSGAVSLAANKNLIIDTSAPNDPVVDDGSYSTSVSTAIVSWTGGNDVGAAGIDSYFVSIGTTAGGANAISNYSCSGSPCSITGLSLIDGTRYYASVKAIDKAGNASAIAIGDGWVVDNTAPVINSVTVGASPTSLSKSPPLIVNANDSGGIATYELRILDGATEVVGWTAFTPGTVLTGQAFLARKDYHAEVRATDHVGLVSNVFVTTTWDYCPLESFVFTAGANVAEETVSRDGTADNTITIPRACVGRGVLIRAFGEQGRLGTGDYINARTGGGGYAAGVFDGGVLAGRTLSVFIAGAGRGLTTTGTETGTLSNRHAGGRYAWVEGTGSSAQVLRVVAGGGGGFGSVANPLASSILPGVGGDAGPGIGACGQSGGTPCGKNGNSQSALDAGLGGGGGTKEVGVPNCSTSTGVVSGKDGLVSTARNGKGGVGIFTLTKDGVTWTGGGAGGGGGGWGGGGGGSVRSDCEGMPGGGGGSIVHGALSSSLIAGLNDGRNPGARLDGKPKVVITTGIPIPTVCPTNYVYVPSVPGRVLNGSDEADGVLGFCLAKYEASANSGRAASQPSVAPWTSYSQFDATVACQANPNTQGYFEMVSTDQWQAVAQVLQSVRANWSGGLVHSGVVNSGNTTNSLQPAPSTEAGLCENIGTSNCTQDDFKVRRAHKLPSGQWIWDFAGNAAEWSRDTGGALTTQIVRVVDFPSTNPLFPNYGPSLDYSYSALSPTDGYLFGSINFTAGWNSVIRGRSLTADPVATGLFATELVQDGSSDPKIGFRCVYEPLPPE